MSTSANDKYQYGFTLPYAILISIVVCCFSLFLLSYFKLADRLTVKNEIRLKGNTYGYEGLNYCRSSYTAYNLPFIYNTPDGYHVFLLKERWGGYDLLTCISMSEAGDTIFSKKLLCGIVNEENDVALYIKGSGQPLIYIADSVKIHGRCFIPGGKFRNYLSSGNTVVPDVLPGRDTLIQPQLDKLYDWLHAFQTEVRQGKLVLSEPVKNSFFNEEKVITADSVIIASELLGNVIVNANTIITTKEAMLKHAILIARSVFFNDRFEGDVQVIASDTIVSGKNARFYYPSLMMILPDLNKGSNEKGSPIIKLKENTQYNGELLAYKSGNKTKALPLITVSENCHITGGIYNSGYTDIQGVLWGILISNKLLGYVNSMMQENLIRHTTINRDSLPPFYTFSTIFPQGKKIKSVDWLQ